jgi:hypothetical protein
MAGFAARPRSRHAGFWSGMGLGILLGLAAALALALVFPPFVFQPPRLPDAADAPPAEPVLPAGQAARIAPPAAPVAGPLRPPPPKPLMDARPDLDRPPLLDGLRPVPSPEIFGGAGSPSLVPPSE